MSNKKTSELNMIDIVDMMQTARQRGVQFPQIKLVDFSSEPNEVIVLRLQGPKSKHFGSVAVTSDGNYGDNEFYGRIQIDGTWCPAGFFARKEATKLQALECLLIAVCEEPELMLAEQGKTTGECCFCHRQLTNPLSKELGMGPECRRHFGITKLPESAKQQNLKLEA